MTPQQENSSSGGAARSVAVELFAQFLERTESGERLEIEEYLRAHASHRADLRRLHADWRLMELTPSRPGANVQVIDERSDPAAWQQFLERLRAHSPDDSRYQIGEELSRGAMGRIMSVFDRDLQRHQVMKLMLGGDPASTTQRGRFLEEAQVTAQLDHPGIVPVHDLGIDQHGQIFFTMKRVTGDDLRHVFRRVRERRPGWSQFRVVGILQSACEAMESAHDRGVIHRDLKPANIMVGAFGETYVMDFGLARVSGPVESEPRLAERETAPVSRSPVHQSVEREREAPVTLDGDVLGTPAYMSPEQARGRLKRLGPHSDVYAMGAILYELLAGHMPYGEPGAATSPHAILARVLSEAPPGVSLRAPGAPPELVAICERAMAREIAKRYGSMHDLAAELRAYLEHRVVLAYESGPVAELRKWIGRNRLLTTTAIAAAIVIVFLTGWFLFGLKAQEREARRIAGVALEARRVADARQQELRRLSDVRVLAGLKSGLDGLWPALPGQAGAMRRWLLEAERLAARLPVHRKTLENLRRLARPQAPGAEPAGTRPTYLFDDQRLTWWHQTLTTLVADLTAFAGERRDGDTIAGLRSRLAFAETVQNYSITYYQEEWENAIESISDEAECPAYERLVIREQLGLVPIGRDPNSGLWEFWHLQTGERPQRDSQGRLLMTEHSGLVFVLIPGGSFWMGAQSSDDSGRNYDPYAQQIESDGRGNPIEITLEPFLLSKYELTQGQWKRFTGSNPSQFAPGQVLSGQAVTLLHPVERVSWDDCARTLGQLDLILPTEAQWEYACRAGSDTPWWTGAARDSLLRAGNLADQRSRRNNHPPDAGRRPGLDDGYARHAPIGRFRANPFGLFDMLGNLLEWCQDAAGPYHTAPEPGNGVRLRTDRARRVQRGGSYAQDVEWARSARRFTDLSGNRTATVGLRPARELR